MSVILVTGAAGFVGSHVVPALVDAGHSILALVRDPDDAALLVRRLTPAQRSSVEARTGDVTDPGSLPAAVAGADAVVHLAAIPRDWDGGASLRLVNTEGTRNVLAAAKGAGIRRFVHLGAMGVADDPDLHYASSKARAMALVRDSGLDWTILSPSVLYGPRDGFFNILAGLVRLSPGIVPITGTGAARFQPLAIGDLAQAVVLALGDPATIGHEYLLGGPRYWTYREIMEEVLRGMGKRRLLRADASRGHPARGRRRRGRAAAVPGSHRSAPPAPAGQRRAAGRRADRLRVRSDPDGGSARRYLRRTRPRPGARRHRLTAGRSGLPPARGTSPDRLRSMP